jgi:hypothetical protein
MDKKELIKKIKEEEISYNGFVNLASHCRPGNLRDIFQYGVKVGVECAKEDIIRIINTTSNRKGRGYQILSAKKPPCKKSITKQKSVPAVDSQQPTS